MNAERVKFASGCTRESHEALKLDAAAFAEQTYLIGEMPVDDGKLLMVNCRACESTLCIEVVA